MYKFEPKSEDHRLSRDGILKAAILGQGLQHSLSPILHSKLFPILQSKFETQFYAINYSAVECASAPEAIQWIGEAAKQGFRGANITTPFKENVRLAMQRVSREASKAVAVNTILFDPKPICSVTDGQGFMDALQYELPIESLNGHLIIIGAGGAARAVFNRLLDFRWEKITVAVRNPDRA